MFPGEGRVLPNCQPISQAVLNADSVQKYGFQGRIFSRRQHCRYSKWTIRRWDCHFSSGERTVQFFEEIINTGQNHIHQNHGDQGGNLNETVDYRRCGRRRHRRCQARRLNEEAEIILFERGEFISFANCGLPYYIGDVIKERDSLLVTTVADFQKRYAIDIRIFSEVTAIDRKQHEVVVRNIQTGATYRESYDKIIPIAGHLEYSNHPFPLTDLENIYNLRNIPDSERIKQFVDAANPQSAVIVGGGFISLEMAENLAIRG
ncbi:MAG: FAD-dependent oxidoreductase [Desulfobacterales bacterium]